MTRAGQPAAQEYALPDETRLLSKLRQRLGRAVFDYGLHGLSRLGQLYPDAQPHRHGVEVLRDRCYLESGTGDPDGSHRVDIYRPMADATRAQRQHRSYGPPYPVVLYIHGGGFRILSKDTHWVMALAMARRGMVVFNINYRLSPKHPFPAALIDCADALSYVLREAPRLGGDLQRLVFAGESAGANLATALTLLTCMQRREPWAQKVYALGQVPRAVLPMCGVLQVSDPQRFARRRPLPAFLHDRLVEVANSYLHSAPAESVALADPLLMLENRPTLDRPLPPFFAGVGTRDPLLDDTRRLAQALSRLGTAHEVRYYPGEVHAFHALVYRAQARACWRDQFAFLARHLGE